VNQYLIRIAIYDHRLHAAITINPNALKEAEQLDRERAQGKVRGPLHGISHCPEGQHPHHGYAHHRRRARLRRVCASL
jgi:hypothetical protein